MSFCFPNTPNSLGLSSSSTVINMYLLVSFCSLICNCFYLPLHIQEDTTVKYLKSLHVPMFIVSTTFLILNYKKISMMDLLVAISWRCVFYRPACYETTPNNQKPSECMQKLKELENLYVCVIYRRAGKTFFVYTFVYLFRILLSSVENSQFVRIL